MFLFLKEVHVLPGRIDLCDVVFLEAALWLALPLISQLVVLFNQSSNP